MHAALTDGRDRPARRRTRQRVVHAPPGAVFSLLTDVGRHDELDGSGMLQGRPHGPERLVLGSRFTMAMCQRGVSYRSVNRVVEYRPDRLIAWETTGEVAGVRVVGGQRWRFELEPTEGGRSTLVTQTYDWSRALLPRLTVELPGYPDRMERAMAATLERLAAAVSRSEVG
ncbi:SRPBCC family protein [Ornithinimicrobium cerasi]|uniref:SRPBCC family protein n=1 Tax=Ornithinimicrobium cerasi TaxID=2248773 RepID=UPI000EFE943B|nr:SRPBCC family protein [Ornithinimicrobium cerasi]